MTQDTTPELPASIDDADRLRERLASGPLLAATDFDGTLAPIVERPADAQPRENARRALAAIAEMPDVQVALVSGRGLADLQERADLDVQERADLGAEGRADLEAVAYAGNHGLEIEVGDRERVHPAAEDARAELADALETVAEVADDLAGARIEDKRLTATVHYRNVDDPGEETRLRDAIASALADADSLERTHAKQAVEIRPAVDWDKGRAIEWLLEEVAPDGATPLYVGDDETDEDGFRAIGEDGVTIRVGDGDTDAEWRVPDPEAVAAVFEWLAAVRTADGE